MVLAIATATFVATLLDLTLEEGVVHHGYRALAAGDIGGLRALLRAALLVDLSIGVVLAVLLAAVAVPLADLVSEGELDPVLLQVAAIMVLASTLDGMTGAVLLVAGRPDLRGWTIAGTNLTRVIGIIVGVQLGEPAAVVGAYAVGSAVGAAAQIWLAWRVAWRDWARAAERTSSRAWIRPLTIFGIHTSITSSLSTAERSLVPVMLGALAGTVSAGIFNIALLPMTIVAVASAPLRLLLFPEQAKLAADGDVGSLRSTVRGYTKIGLAIGIPSAGLAFVLMPWLIPALFTDKYESAVEPARILLIAAVFHLCAGWTKTLPAAIGRPQMRSAMAGVYLVISVTLTALLAPEHGATGAAIALSAAAAVTITCWWFLAEHELRKVGREPPSPRERVA